MVVLALPGMAQAQGDVDRSGTWQYEITPYLWGSAMKGDVKISGVVPKTHVDMSFSDIMENLDSGLMGTFEARKDRWGILFDVIYMNVSSSATAIRTGPEDAAVIASANANLHLKQTMLAAAVAYRVTEGRAALDLIGGARYSQIKVEADIHGSFFGLAGTVARGGSKDWVDPYIGMRVQHPVADGWTLIGYADVGGFGVGSDLSWQMAVGLNYKFSRTFSGKLGYRYIGVDYDKGGFLYDMANSGAYLGVGIGF